MSCAASFRSARSVFAAICLVVATAAPTAAAIFRVGNDGIPPCTHTTLAGAVAAAAANGVGTDQIYLSDPQTLSSPIVVNNQSVEIVGGFSSCSDDDPGTSLTNLTVATNDAIQVVGGTSLRVVNLQNLLVLRPSANPPARLLRIQDHSFVFLSNTTLSGGEADNGGNVWMSGPDTYLSINQWLGAWSAVYAADASGAGGGIYCENGGTVELADGAITGNTAGTDGGGVYLNGCTLSVYSGQATDPSCSGVGGKGVNCNSAGQRGGGIYAGGASEVNLSGNASAPALVFDNAANEGGGIYLTGAGTILDAENSWIVENTSAVAGGGAFVRAGASFTMRTTADDCRGARCSLLRRNFASMIGGVGGALATDGGADVTLLQTTITANAANVTGSVIHASGAGTTVLLEGCLVHDNTGSLNDAYVDTFAGALVTAAFSTFDEDMGCCKALFDTNTSSTVEIFSSILLPISEGNGDGRIFDEPIAAGETRVADCLLYQESSATLPPPPPLGSFEVVSNVTALFANWAGRDLRLTAGSQAIDFCDTFNYTPVTTDIERQARGFNVVTIPDSPFGPFDLGADEWRPILVADHEEGTCVDWSSDTGGC